MRGGRSSLFGNIADPGINLFFGTVAFSITLEYDGLSLKPASPDFL